MQRLKNWPIKKEFEEIKAFKEELFDLRLKLASGNKSIPWTMVDLEEILKKRSPLIKRKQKRKFGSILGVQNVRCTSYMIIFMYCRVINNEAFKNSCYYHRLGSTIWVKISGKIYLNIWWSQSIKIIFEIIFFM